MSAFLKQFDAALGGIAKNMNSGGLDKPVLDSLTALGQAANVLAKTTANALVAKGLNDQTEMLNQAMKDIEAPPPPEVDLQTVPPPEQLGHAPENPTESEGPQPGPEASTEATASEGPSMPVGMNSTPTTPELTHEEARKLLKENHALHGFFKSVRVEQDGNYDFMQVPIQLIGNLLAHFRGKSRSNGGTKDEVALFTFLQGIMEKRPDRVRAAGVIPTTIMAHFTVRLFHLTYITY